MLKLEENPVVTWRITKTEPVLLKCNLAKISGMRIKLIIENEVSERMEKT